MSSNEDKSTTTGEGTKKPDQNSSGSAASSGGNNDNKNETTPARGRSKDRDVRSVNTRGSPGSGGSGGSTQRTPQARDLQSRVSRMSSLGSSVGGSRRWSRWRDTIDWAVRPQGLDIERTLWEMAVEPSEDGDANEGSDAENEKTGKVEKINVADSPDKVKKDSDGSPKTAANGSKYTPGASNKASSLTISDIDTLDFSTLYFSAACPVTMQCAVRFNTLTATVGEDGVSEQIKCKFSVSMFWNDPRLAGWPENKELPPDIWRPECAFMMKLKNTYKESAAATATKVMAPKVAVLGGPGSRSNSKENLNQEQKQETTEVNNKDSNNNETEGGSGTTKPAGENKSNASGGNTNDLVNIPEGDEENEDDAPADDGPTINAHWEIPMPTFWNGNEGRAAGRIFIELPLESDDLDMLADPTRLLTFPFDKIRFEFFLILSGEKRVETQDKLVAVWGPKEFKHNHFAISLSSTHAGEFQLTAISYAKVTHASPATGLVYEDLGWSVHMHRNATFYLFKGIIPLMAGTFFGFMSFTLSPEELSGRLQLQVAIFLTCFAIQWLITERLPRVPYLTILDHVVFGAVGSLCLMSFGQCLAYGFGKGSTGFWGEERTASTIAAANVSVVNPYDFDLYWGRRVDIATLIFIIALQIYWGTTIYSSRIRRIRFVIRDFLYRMGNKIKWLVCCCGRGPGMRKKSSNASAGTTSDKTSPSPTNKDTTPKKDGKDTSKSKDTKEQILDCSYVGTKPFKTNIGPFGNMLMIKDDEGWIIQDVEANRGKPFGVQGELVVPMSRY